jgi:SNF2 family DNA or RNA helicase
VTGSKKEAQAIESQAIGRAFRQGQTKQITIVRFVVKNTIEHALYLRNNDVNEDTTVVVTKDNKPQLVRSIFKCDVKALGQCWEPARGD